LGCLAVVILQHPAGTYQVTATNGTCAVFKPRPANVFGRCRAARRLLGRVYPDGSRNTFVYDEASNRVRMEDTTGVTTSTFDPLDRRQSVVTPAGKAVTYAYDEVGLRASMMGN